MLKKIENINSTTEFKNNTRFSSGIGALPIISAEKSSIADSLKFSSALKYFSQLKWHLKSLVRTENDELLVEFNVGKLTLNTKINLYDCKPYDIIYKISNREITTDDGDKYEIVISFDFDSNVYSEPLMTWSVKYWESIFERFLSYDNILLKNSNDPEINAFFLDDSEENLVYEISLIHRNLILFVEKVTAEVVSSNLKAASDLKSKREKKIKILKINV